MSILKKILVGFAIAVLLLVPLLYGFAYFMGSDIKRYAEKEIGSAFTTEVTFERLDISLFKAFPKVSVKFTDLTINEKYNISGRHVFSAQEVSLVFNLWDVLGKKFRLRQVILEDALINLAIDKKGRMNFMVLRGDSTSTSSDPFKADLDKVLLRDCRIRYEDKQGEQLQEYLVRKMTLSGRFNDARFALDAQGDADLQQFVLNNRTILKDKYVNLDANLQVDAGKQLYTLGKSTLKLGNLGFRLSGKVQGYENATDMDVHIDGEKMDIQSFLGLLPNEYKTRLKDYESDGRFYFQADIKGKASAKSNPGITVKFGIADATVHHKGVNVPLEHLNLTGSYTNGGKHAPATSALYIKDMKAVLAGRAIHANATLTNFEHPRLELQANGGLNMVDAYKFIKVDEIKQVTGEVKFELQFSGFLDDLRRRETVSRVKCAGFVNAENLLVQYNDNRPGYKQVNARMRFTQNDLAIEKIEGITGQTDFRFSGIIQNLTAYALLPNQRILVDGDFHSSHINASELLQHDDSKKKDTSALNVQLPADIDLDLKLSCGRLDFYRFKASDFAAAVTMKNRMVKVSNLVFDAMGGHFRIPTASVVSRGKNGFITMANITCNNVNITDLFYQCNNFGQQEITDKNLSGKLKADITFGATWNSKLEADMDQLYTYADLNLANGALKKYEPLRSLSKYVKVSELENVRFSTLQNQIEIKGQEIVIPVMKVDNNALNMEIAGKHSFSNNMDYHFKIRLKELVAGKYNWRKERPADEIEEDEKGGLSVFIRMFGTPETLQFAYDKRASKASFNATVKSEKKVIGDLFREEFNKSRRDEGTGQTVSEDQKEDKPKETLKERIKNIKKRDDEEEEQMQYE